MRIDPGERIIVEIVDYDEDRTDQRDTVKFASRGQRRRAGRARSRPKPRSTRGIFTKEVDTQRQSRTKDKLEVKPGDRIYIRYLDTQNTFPGHSVPREAVVYVTAADAGHGPRAGNAGHSAAEGFQGAAADRRPAAQEGEGNRAAWRSKRR